MLSDYPQGGFITRQPTQPTVATVKKNKNGFGFLFFQRNPDSAQRRSQGKWLLPPRR